MTGTPERYCEQMYACGPHPWSLRERWYERRKRSMMTAALPRDRYRRAFEPGCAGGALTERLAGLACRSGLSPVPRTVEEDSRLDVYVDAPHGSVARATERTRAADVSVDAVVVLDACTDQSAAVVAGRPGVQQFV